MFNPMDFDILSFLFGSLGGSVLGYWWNWRIKPALGQVSPPPPSPGPTPELAPEDLPIPPPTGTYIKQICRSPSGVVESVITRKVLGVVPKEVVKYHGRQLSSRYLLSSGDGNEYTYIRHGQK